MLKEVFFKFDCILLGTSYNRAAYAGCFPPEVSHRMISALDWRIKRVRSSLNDSIADRFYKQAEPEQPNRRAAMFTRVVILSLGLLLGCLLALSAAQPYLGE